MKPLKIVSVSYLNSMLFNYGLNKWADTGAIELVLCHPANCATLILEGKADIGLVPVGALLNCKKYRIVSDYCIGCNGEVKSVGIFSISDIKSIKTLWLDNESRTSVLLAKIIFEKYLEMKPEYKPANVNTKQQLEQNEGMLAIGDKAILMQSQNQYHYFDLGKTWKDFTGLPFVFACWVSIKDIEKGVLLDFNNFLGKGILQKDSIIEKLESHKNFNSQFNYQQYFEKNVQFRLDENMLNGLKLFNTWARSFEQFNEEKNK